MKRMIIGLVMALFVIVSCDVSDIDDSVVFSNKKVPATIKAEQVDEGGTKTIRNLDKSVSWMPSDEIAVFCGAEKAKFTSTNTENALTASFTGELSESLVHAINNGTNTNTIWGLYPYDENAVYDGTYITTTLPAQQTGIAGTFDDDLFISLAQSTNFSMYFYNVCSGFKFSVTKEGITSITLKGNNNEDIAGKVKLSFADGKPKVEVVEGEKTITLVPEGSTFEVGKDYYFVILPIDFTQGFTISLNTMSQTGNYAYSKSVDFPRSKFVNKANVDEAITYVQHGNIVIPDANFKAYLVQNYDTSNDGEISYVEGLAITRIDVNTVGIASLKGIESFPNLKYLSCSPEYNSSQPSSHTMYYMGQEVVGLLTELDVSQNPLLEYLYCEGNQLASLDVSNNTELIGLGLGFNFLSEISLSSNTKLNFLYCGSNQLSSLDVNNNTQLTDLSCEYNKLESLSISNNVWLRTLNCHNNYLTTLDISNNEWLQQVSCSCNQLESLSFTTNLRLTSLNCDNNQLHTLNVMANTQLKTLYCYSNLLESLDLSNNVALTKLDCSANRLSTLGLTNNEGLKDINCSFNQLISIDISHNSRLEDFNCSNNQIKTLNVSSNLMLKGLICGENQLTDLDVINNAELFWLDCHSNQLSRLDVSCNLSMARLVCLYNPSLTEIWLKTGQSIGYFLYDTSIATIQYKD